MCYIEYTYIIKNFKEYLKNRKFKLNKQEVIKKGPINRWLNGVSIKYDIENFSINLYFDEELKFFAIDIIFYSVFDSYIDVSYIEINDSKKIYIKDEEKIFNIIDENIKKKNKVSIFFLTEGDILYELGCILYLSFDNYPEEYFKDMELDTWDD